MRYILTINQRSFQENFPKIDILGACIYDVLKNLCSVKSEKIKKLTFENEEYTWADYNMIIDELPIFNLSSKHAIFRRINQLKTLGLIKTKSFRNDQGHENLYVRITEKALLIEEYNPVSPGEQGIMINPHQNNALFPQKNRENENPVSPGESILVLDKKDIYISRDNFETPKKRDEIAMKLVEIYNQNIGTVRFKPKIASRMKELFKDFQASELREIILKKANDDWFMKNLAQKGPIWFFSNKTRLFRYLDEE